jgi:hypothetical protein
MDFLLKKMMILIKNLDQTKFKKVREPKLLFIFIVQQNVPLVYLMEYIQLKFGMI